MLIRSTVQRHTVPGQRVFGRSQCPRYGDDFWARPGLALRHAFGESTVLGVVRKSSQFDDGVPE